MHRNGGHRRGTLALLRVVLSPASFITFQSGHQISDSRGYCSCWEGGRGGLPHLVT